MTDEMSSEVHALRTTAPSTRPDALVHPVTLISVFQATLENESRLSPRAFGGRPYAVLGGTDSAGGLIAIWRAPRLARGRWWFMLSFQGSNAAISLIAEGRRVVSRALPPSSDLKRFLVSYDGELDVDAFLVLHACEDAAMDVTVGDIAVYDRDPQDAQRGTGFTDLPPPGQGFRMNSALQKQAPADRFDLELCRRLISDLDDPLPFAPELSPQQQSL